LENQDRKGTQAEFLKKNINAPHLYRYCFNLKNDTELGKQAEFIWMQEI
jgi:adenylate kinase family enzyme